MAGPVSDGSIPGSFWLGEIAEAVSGATTRPAASPALTTAGRTGTSPEARAAAAFWPDVRRAAANSPDCRAANGVCAGLRFGRVAACRWTLSSPEFLCGAVRLSAGFHGGITSSPDGRSDAAATSPDAVKTGLDAASVSPEMFSGVRTGSVLPDGRSAAGGVSRVCRLRLGASAERCSNLAAMSASRAWRVARASSETRAQGSLESENVETSGVSEKGSDEASHWARAVLRESWPADGAESCRVTASWAPGSRATGNTPEARGGGTGPFHCGTGRSPLESPGRFGRSGKRRKRRNGSSISGPFSSIEKSPPRGGRSHDAIRTCGDRTRFRRNMPCFRTCEQRLYSDEKVQPSPVIRGLA